MARSKFRLVNPCAQPFRQMTNNRIGMVLLIFMLSHYPTLRRSSREARMILAGDFIFRVARLALRGAWGRSATPTTKPGPCPISFANLFHPRGSLFSAMASEKMASSSARDTEPTSRFS